MGVQVASGLLLGCHYTGLESAAFSSIGMLQRDLGSGMLVRGVHANGATLMFAVIYLHMGRTLFRGMGNRASVWLVGVVIYVLGIGTCFTGYSLVYGQMSMWAIVVICSLVTATPVIGPDLLTLVWGGSVVSTATLGRLYVVHYLLALVMVGLALAHIWLLHNVGSTGGYDAGVLCRGDRVDFEHAYVTRDVAVGGVGLGILGVLTCWYGSLMGEPENYCYADPLVTPVTICPEWYMMPYYGLVRAIPSKPLGIVGMGLAFGALINTGDVGYRTGVQNRQTVAMLFVGLVEVVILCSVCLQVNHGESLYLLLVGSVLGVCCGSLQSLDKLTSGCERSGNLLSQQEPSNRQTR